jgi:hypothetical protein
MSKTAEFLQALLRRLITIALLAYAFFLPIEKTTAQEPSPAETAVDWINQFSLPEQGEDGWSILTPSSDSRLIYVSSSGGNDSSGAIYSPADTIVGASPQLPTGSIQPYATISHALTLVREGYPDWVLLKRGDSWTRDSVVDVKSGRSTSERSVITYYGTELPRPRINASSSGLRFWRSCRFAAVVGLEFYAYTRDPASPNFVGFNNVGSTTGFNSYTSDAENPNRSLLIEDSVFNFFSNNTIQGTIETKDVIIRRCQFLNNYSTTSHSQGMYTSKVSALLEENLFDHNGWYKQQIGGGNDQAEGQATMFNHNTYFTNTNKTIFRRNMFIRGASSGCKFTSNSPGVVDQINAEKILLDNNLIVRGEVGVSIGGNTDLGTGVRWEDVHLVNNIFIDIGTDQPTNRTLGWGAWLDDWQDSVISGNYFIHYGNDTVSNIFGIWYGEHGQNVDIIGNVFYGLDSHAAALQVRGSDPKSHIRVFGNRFQLQNTEMIAIRTDYVAPQVFFGNYYYSDRESGEWFQVDSNYMSLSEWSAQTGDTNSQIGALDYPDPNRTMETYAAHLGHSASLEAFIEQAKQQSKLNWQEAYTAVGVNSYLRAGFDRRANSTPSPPGVLRIIAP